MASAMDARLLWASLALLTLATSTAACSKHDCKLDEKQAKYFGEIALTTKGADLCMPGVEPYGCDLAGDRCSPTLTTIHYELSPSDAEAHFKSALVGQGWKYYGEKVSEDGSRALAFTKSDKDELFITSGKAPGGKGSETYMIRRPESATGSILEKFTKAND